MSEWRRKAAVDTKIKQTHTQAQPENKMQLNAEYKYSLVYSWSLFAIASRALLKIS